MIALSANCVSLRDGLILALHLTLQAPDVSLHFPGFTLFSPQDLAGMSLRRGQVQLYPKGSPPIGTGLNKRCILSFKGRLCKQQQVRGQECRTLRNEGGTVSIQIQHFTNYDFSKFLQDSASEQENQDTDIDEIERTCKRTFKFSLQDHFQSMPESFQPSISFQSFGLDQLCNIGLSKIKDGSSADSHIKADQALKLVQNFIEVTRPQMAFCPSFCIQSLDSSKTVLLKNVRTTEKPLASLILKVCNHLPSDDLESISSKQLKLLAMLQRSLYSRQLQFCPSLRQYRNDNQQFKSFYPSLRLNDSLRRQAIVKCLELIREQTKLMPEGEQETFRPKELRHVQALRQALQSDYISSFEVYFLDQAKACQLNKIIYQKSKGTSWSTELLAKLKYSQGQDPLSDISSFFKEYCSPDCLWIAVLLSPLVGKREEEFQRRVMELAQRGEIVDLSYSFYLLRERGCMEQRSGLKRKVIELIISKLGERVDKLTFIQVISKAPVQVYKFTSKICLDQLIALKLKSGDPFLQAELNWLEFCEADVLDLSRLKDLRIRTNQVDLLESKLLQQSALEDFKLSQEEMQVVGQLKQSVGQSQRMTIILQLCQQNWNYQKLKKLIERSAALDSDSRLKVTRFLVDRIAEKNSRLNLFFHLELGFEDLFRALLGCLSEETDRRRLVVSTLPSIML